MHSATDYRERKCRPAGRARQFVAALLLATASSAVWAQTPPAPVLPPTREEVTRPEAQQERNRAVRLEVEGSIERAPCALDSPEFASVKFTVRGATFDGLQGISPDALSESYAPLIGTQQPISAVCDIRDRAATLLRNEGYIAAVQVPEQRIEDGIVHFKVVMARLTQVRVRGDATGAEKVIAAYLTQLTRQPVFNRRDAERYLLLSTDLPGYTVRLTLRPAGTGPGEVLGDVTVQRIPAYIDANIENGGSHELGPWGGLARAQIYGLTGLADRTTLAAFATADLKEQKTLQIGHDFAVGSDGLRLSGLFTYGWAQPSIEDLDLRSETLLATVQADYPFVRTLAQTLHGAAGIDFINQYVAFESHAYSRDRLRVAFLHADYDAISTDFNNGRSFAEPLWHVGATFDLRKGIDMLGATDSCPTLAPCGHLPTSRVGGISTATVVRALLYGEYRPAPRLTLALSARGQYAWDPLLSFEFFSAGNYTVGRGYDPGSLLGDRGWGTQAEVRYGKTIPSSARKAAVEGYLFYDHAEVDSIGDPLLPGAKKLDSVGAGARVNFKRFQLDGSIAVPLSHIGDPPVKPDPRILVSLTTRLFPWTYK